MNDDYRELVMRYGTRSQRHDDGVAPWRPCNCMQRWMFYLGISDGDDGYIYSPLGSVSLGGFPGLAYIY